MLPLRPTIHRKRLKQARSVEGVEDPYRHPSSIEFAIATAPSSVTSSPR